MQLRKLTRFFKASTLLMLAALAVTTFAPLTRAQEQININSRFLNLPGGLGNTMLANGVAQANSLFPLAGSGQGSSSVSDVIGGEFNGDGFQDVLCGSLNSDELVLFLGRGNGSFVLANRASLSGSGAAAASQGRVTSIAQTNGFGTTSRTAVAVDYVAGGTLNDRVVFVNINAQGAFALSSFSPSMVASTTSDPVALAVGSLDTGGFADLVILCSGQNDPNTAGSNATGGFVAVDRSDPNTGRPDGVIEQRIGGGTDLNNVVVAENGQSGSVYDARDNVNAGLPVTPDNTYNLATDAPNRRRFRITPNSEVAAGIQPRAISLGNSSHRDDGANDLFFVAVDFGSTNASSAGVIAPGAPGIGGVIVPAQQRAAEGTVFCLVNNQFTTGNILRNARRLDEQYDYTNNPVTATGQQDGVILRAGNVPTGVAVGDLNGDNRLDVACSNSGGGTVSISLSANINDNNITNPFVGQQITSYQNPIFVQVGGSPNTVYTRDLNNDGRIDICGTNLASAGGYAVFNNANAAGTFTNGAILFSPASQSPGATRSLAVTNTPFNGLSSGIDFANSSVPGGPQSGQPDAVFARTSSFGGVGVRYGISSTTTSVTFGVVPLSSFVGVFEGRINGDTLPDVAIADRGADRAIVVLNGAAGFASSATTTTFIDLGDLFPNIEAGGITAIDGGDVDKNGSTDLVLSVDGPNDQAIVLYNIGGFSDIDARFTIRAFPIGGDPTAIKLADLAGPAGPGQGGATARDGAPEIIAVNRRSNTVTTLINNGIGIFGQGRVAETGGFDPLSQALADYNDDGKLDTAVLNRGRRGAIADPNQTDDSIVSILLGNGDGSFQATNFLIPVARGSVSIAAAGYGIVRQAVQIDIPDANLDGITDLVVASQLGGGPSSDVINPFTGNNEAGALTLLTGSSTQPGQFTRGTTPQPLIDTLGSGGRLGIYPGAVDVRDGRIIGYGVIALNGDYNQNGRVDAHIGGVERNNGAVGSGTSATNFLLEQGFAGSVTSLDNLSAAFGAQRTFNVFPSATNDSNTITARVPVDVDNVTGVVSASNYVVSATGTIVGQDVNDFSGGFGQIVPDIVQVTSIGRAYININVASVLNHAPVVTTSRGLADFSGPGRKVVMNEGEEVKITLRAGDIDPSAPGSLRFSLVTFPSFVSMVDNNNGTATVTIKPSLTDGSATANNGLGQRYNFQAQVTDNDFRLPLTGNVFFSIFVKDKPTAPTIAPIPDQVMKATQTLQVPVIATDATNRVLTLSTTFNQSFSTFTDAGGGTGQFQFRPMEANGGVFNVSVTVMNDLNLSSTTSFKLTVIVNTAPTVGSLANVTLASCETRTVNATATDPDSSDIVTLALTEAPSFVTLADNGNKTATLNINPSCDNANVGTFRVTVVARDTGVPAKTSAPVSFTITVTPRVFIASASFAKKRLFISGVGFGTSPTVTVNGKALPPGLLLAPINDVAVTAKGNKKALGLRKGANTIQVTGLNGVKSNVATVNLADDED